MLNSFRHREKQMKTTLRLHLTLVRIATTRTPKIINGRMLPANGVRGILVYIGGNENECSHSRYW